MRNIIGVGAMRLGLAGWALAMCAGVALGQVRGEPLPDAPVATSSNPGAQLGAARDIDVSWKNLPARILHDQKDIWLFPLQLAKGHYWIPSLAVAGGTAGLIAADPQAVPYFRTRERNWDDFNDTFDGTITSAEMGFVPVTLLLVGGARHDSYSTKTGLLAGEAYANGAIVDTALKAITRRRRPRDVAAGAPFNDTFFETPTSPLGSSFPSGHAVAAFSIATVVARRYGHHKWVPWVAYGAATAIGFSRVTTRAHFPSDVFLGAALGYSIARFEVLRH